MTTPTHICAGYLIAQVCIALKIIPADMGHQLTLVSVTAANLPDFDVIGSVRKKNLLMHRKSRMHTPIYWLIFFLLTSAVFILFNVKTILILNLIVFFNILIHFIMDTYTPDNGIRWLAPYSQKEYGPLVKTFKPESVIDMLHSYIQKPMLKYEFAFWVGTLIIRAKLQ